MVDGDYSANLSRPQGRSEYAIIFRHPARRDEVTGRLGRRVRRGLGTRDNAEAERFRDELNQLLADPKFHDPAARAEAERRFTPRIVDIFYGEMVAEEIDCFALRNKEIPLPPREPGGYRHVLFLGTTGAGKTTLVRQIIGTDPLEERFPSTSTSKTTIHDTEIILDDGPWRAVVTFVSRDETREHLNECISEAVRRISRNDGVSNDTVLRYLLQHVNQRFRFNYILGNGPKSAQSYSDFDDEDQEFGDAKKLLFDKELGAIDLAKTDAILDQSLTQLRELASSIKNRLQAELEPDDEEGDQSAFDELFEEQLDDILRNEGIFYTISDALMDEIEKRFETLAPSAVTNTREGWPQTWKGEWPINKRREFIESVSRFSSNYQQQYGFLLTPLVNGVRVAGPFSPTWMDGRQPKLVLFDGEGLGHTPRSSSSISTGVSRRIDAADTVLLVDNATQPMQAAPHAAMREIVATGNGRKLIFVFTHFDGIQGDNFANADEKFSHVRASVENVLSSFKDLGPYAERILRERLDTTCFFLANLQERHLESASAGRGTIRQIQKLLNSIDQATDRPEISQAHPVYDIKELNVSILSAAGAFHEIWKILLGLENKPGFTKEHWTRIKALSRRLAVLGVDEYDSLRPVADLRQKLQDRIYLFVQNPLRWEGCEPSDEEKENKYNALADNLGRRLLDLSTRRVWHRPIDKWQEAYDESGKGSTFVRAEMIGNDIYVSAAPVSDTTPSGRNQLLEEVVAEFRSAAEDVGALLR